MVTETKENVSCMFPFIFIPNHQLLELEPETSVGAERRVTHMESILELKLASPITNSTRRQTSDTF
jgi:hypothetical protein